MKDAISLRDYQVKAVNDLKDGSILCGGVGSGKTRTSIAYYFCTEGGSLKTGYLPTKKPRDLYVITTAKKRDGGEWDTELALFLLSPFCGYYKNTVVVDSWNNIGKYVGVTNAFFIFDEQRVVGSGAWVKSFIKIAKQNRWILLTATPGDRWLDYIPVFVANGYYKNRTEFINRHVVWDPYSKYPKPTNRYRELERLIRLRDRVLVVMEYENAHEHVNHDILVDFDTANYKDARKRRWDIFDDCPAVDAAGMCRVLRKIVNADPSRIREVERIVKQRERVIIFYNFDYELEILRAGNYGKDIAVCEWNGHKHEEIPTTGKWVYLVNYLAGAEGWNCIQTDTIIFYSQTYSYRTLEQAKGRIDRLNSPYIELHYYHLKSKAPIDIAIARALSVKKEFNESRFDKCWNTAGSC